MRIRRNSDDDNEALDEKYRGFDASEAGDESGLF
ncbi:hypothetical protein FHX11_005692 [Rhizobium sp. BK602]|nr:hypothetical protein [Rhizobium sp. BK602]